MADSNIMKRINEETDIVSLVSEFVTLDKKGKNYMGLCPFHAEKSPSFSVSPEKKIAKCMGCGEGGNVINFYRKIKNLSLDQAVYDLASRLGIESEVKAVKKDPREHLYEMMTSAANFYQFVLRNSEFGQAAMKYLSKREMDEALIDHFLIGVSPNQKDALYQMLKDQSYQVSDMIDLGLVKQSDDGSYYDLFQGRLMFPITNEQGRVVGFSGRTLNPKDKVKYVNSPETPIFKKGELIYHLSDAKRAINQYKQVVLHEGFFDVIASFKAGMSHTVATMGTALTNKQAKMIKAVTEHVILAYDGDSAGLAAMMKAATILQKEKLKLEFLMIPDKMDPDEFVKAYGTDKYDQLYGEYLLDYYQFALKYYEMGKDFKNANDVSAFKDEMQSILRYAEGSIKAHYQQLIYNRYGIHLQFNQKIVLPKQKDNIEFKEIKPEISKYEHAELILIIHLMITDEYFEYIKSHLNYTMLSKPEHYPLLIALEQYYSQPMRPVFNIHHFLEMFPNQRLYVEEHVLTNLNYKNRLKLDSIAEVEKYMSIILSSEDQKRLDDLNVQFKQETDFKKKVVLADQINALVKKIKKGVS